jgi:integrase
MKTRYISTETDRHGRRRIYVRKYGRRVPIHDAPGSVEFARSYARALEQLEHSVTGEPLKRGPRQGTLGWLATQYFASTEFQSLDVRSQHVRRGIIEQCLRELHKGQALRECPLSYVTAAKIKAVRDTKADKRGAANNRLKYLSAMYGWAIEAGKAKSNPVREVRKLKNVTDGFHTWTIEEVRKFEKKHAVGTKARLALALLLYLGVRRGNVVELGPANIDGDVIAYIPRKSRHIRVETVYKPILPELAEILAASTLGKTTFLETALGKPFSPESFGNWFRKQCNDAELLHCSAHGLRKAGATLAAENGATVNQLMAIFDWTTANQAINYTRRADRKRLAAQSMKLLEHRPEAPAEQPRS